MMNLFTSSPSTGIVTHNRKIRKMEFKKREERVRSEGEIYTYNKSYNKIELLSSEREVEDVVVSVELTKRAL